MKKKTLTFKADPNKPAISIAVPGRTDDRNKRNHVWEDAFKQHVRLITSLNPWRKANAPRLDCNAVAYTGYVPQLMVASIRDGKYDLVLTHHDVELTSSDPKRCAEAMVAAWDQKYWWWTRPMDVRPWRTKGDA